MVEAPITYGSRLHNIWLQAFDELEMNRQMFAQEGVPLRGVVLNRVLPDKVEHCVEDTASERAPGRPEVRTAQEPRDAWEAGPGHGRPAFAVRWSTSARRWAR